MIKKAFSIFMATLLLMTGLHLSFASHYCNGDLIAVKFSITGGNASCGMENEFGSTLPPGKFFKTHCCDDDLTTLTVDSNYSSFSFQGKDFAQKVMPDFALPSTAIIPEFFTSGNLASLPGPPGVFRRNSVELAAICVFRI